MTEPLSLVLRSEALVERERPAGRPFPEEAYIGLFAAYRALVAPTTESPDCFGWVAFACSLSVLNGRDAMLPWGSGFMPPVLHGCVVGKSGKGRKSTAFDDAVEMVVEPLKPTAEEGAPEPMEIIVGSGTGEGYSEAIADRTYGQGKEGSDGEASEPKVQIGRRALFVVHELGALLEKVRRDQAGNLVDFVLAAFDARETWSHKTRTKPLVMTRAIGVFMYASTLTWLTKTLSDTQVLSGLANRIIWVVAERKEPLARRPAIPAELIEIFQAKVQAALDAIKGKSFEFTPEADAFHQGRYAIEYYREGESDIATAATARADVLALRVAMILAAADAAHVIDAKHIKAAWAVIDYSNSTVESIVQRIEEQSMREAETRVRAAAERVAAKKSGTFSRRDVRQNVKGKSGMDAEMFNRCWRALVEAGDFVATEDDEELFRVAGGGGTR